MYYKWTEITTEFENYCITCNKLIPAGSKALWMKQLGIKHIECPPEVPDDNSKLVIIDNEDRKLLDLD